MISDVKNMCGDHLGIFIKQKLMVFGRKTVFCRAFSEIVAFQRNIIGICGLRRIVGNALVH
jgi:hypothetical protein